MGDAHALEPAGRLEATPDRGDAGRGLDVAALAHMVDVVLVVDEEGDLELPGWSRLKLLPWLAVAKWPELDRIVDDGVDDHAVVLGWTQGAVLALQDRADRGAGLVPGWCGLAPQQVDHQIGWIGRIRLQRRLVPRARQRPGSPALVEPQTRLVLSPDTGIRREGGVVGEALEVERVGPQELGLAAHPLVQSASHTARGDGGRGGDEVQKTETGVGCVQNQGEPLDHPACVLCDQQHRPEAEFHRVQELPGDLVDLLAGQRLELGAQDLLHLEHRVLVGGRG